MCRINGDKTVVKYIEHFGLGSLRHHWSVDQARESMMELVQEVWWCLIVTHLDSWRCTFYTFCISIVVYGRQTVAEYSRIGQ